MKHSVREDGLNGVGTGENNCCCCGGCVFLIEGDGAVFKKGKGKKDAKNILIEDDYSFSDPVCFSLLSGEVACFFLLPP